MTARPLPHEDRVLPRPLLIAAAVTLAVSLLGAGLGRFADLGRSGDGIAPVEAPIAAREMRFVDRADGGIDVLDAADGRVFLTIAPGEDGFARATLRGLVRDRKKADLGPETPFRLSLWRDGSLVLDDPATGRRVDLRAFGATNRDAFARLLPRSGVALAGETR
ncbi:MAG: photosynthetic complex assembly protein PuhC [Tagaea sp.]